MMKYILFLLLLGHRLLAQTVSVDTFATMLKQSQQAQVIDVRTPAEFAEGHLPGAVNINSQRDDFSQALGTLDKNKPVFVYCLSGGRSKGAVEKLRQLGYTDIHELKGGYLKWSSRMMPIEGVSRSAAKAQWTTDRFDSLVQAQPLVLVDVYAPWCAPCKKMAPVIDRLAEEMAGQATIVKLNADTEKSLIAAYQVDELPTLLLFRNGKLVDRQIGFRDEAALRALLK
ncbi:thioredoxin [Spirosoma taeanense]|uniref:Thioredoxin n=1 Tax=Spirosoma taeanense TaxID=2735870 RepID=A0A6M5Y7F4_9BACT|nr:thioredoxin [Spirosoma taeanense]QJW89404.1 thioredoxin [Spirosoma taeanense]